VSQKDPRVVLITGGAGGMGRATAKRFLEDGGTVFIADINVDTLAEAEADRRLRDDARLETLVVDVTRVADCERMVAAVVEAAGRLDVLVNAAGVWVEGSSDSMTEEEWDQTVDVNLKGTFFCCRYAIPALERTEGCIVNISSDAGIHGTSGNAIYDASKAGVNNLTRSLALELAPRGIRVNAICPADVDTPMLAGQARVYGGDDPQGYLAALLASRPQGRRARFIRPEEIAELVVFLASGKVDPITGACISIDFGMTAGIGPDVSASERTPDTFPR
jgi:NAD(P)-dependent dehydrogenase (short-subunit alcohol dehydrogenase family)